MKWCTIIMAITNQEPPSMLTAPLSLSRTLVTKFKSASLELQSNCTSNAKTDDHQKQSSDLLTWPAIKPFISWAGSKRRLISQILPHMPMHFNRYIEPFLGGGSLFLKVGPQNAILNDACVPLIETWKAIQTDPAGVYREATRRSLNKTNYYEARSERGGSNLEQAGRFLYLNKGAFNGLYRVNLRGEFNVPWGAPKSPFICDFDNLLKVSASLSSEKVDLITGDFEPIIGFASTSDLLFIDPPYVTSHNNNGFIEYNENIFSWNDQIRLSIVAHQAVDRGATVLVTNANHSQVIDLYHGFERVILERASTLAAAKDRRGRTSEILLIGRPTL